MLERLFRLIAAPGEVGDWLTFPVAYAAAWLSDHTLGYTALFTPRVSQLIGEDVAALVLHPLFWSGIFATFCTVLKLAHSSFWKWQESDWRSRALTAEQKLVEGVRAGRIK